MKSSSAAGMCIAEEVKVQLPYSSMMRFFRKQRQTVTLGEDDWERGYHILWDQRPLSTSPGDDGGALSTDALEQVADKDITMPIHLAMAEVYPHCRQTDSSFFLWGTALLQFFRACRFLFKLGYAGSLKELWRSPYPFFMVLVKTFLWGPLTLFTTIVTTITVPLMLETADDSCKQFTPAEMKTRALFVATFGAVTCTRGIEAAICLGKSLVLVAGKSSFLGYPDMKFLLVSTMILSIHELMAMFIILVQSYLLIWASATMLEAVLNGLALSMFFDIDNYIGKAMIYMAGAPFSRFYQPHVLITKDELARAKQNTRYLLTGPIQAWLNFFVRRVVGSFLLYYVWTESVYIPIFTNSFFYASTKDPLNSCSWTSIWTGVALGLRTKLAWY